jgi:hypothetical protein
VNPIIHISPAFKIRTSKVELTSASSVEASNRRT